ncbi:catalase family protein [Janthinobacterium sp. 17J80-10]|uniref:catalase family protein n=1 Tax=Janthinobacterium sp. 17J80-10 TaxID=2497863 RepID=UPI001005305C|nr:catalase family protein [Janthinobacterium sp. 17J80-10]QAU35270.1 catalase [Janthinobacterium sp. 17J80-10]
MTNRTLATESIPPGETDRIHDLAMRLQAKIIRENQGGIMRRDAHPKMHGLVRAEFTVEPGLAPELQIGLFSRPQTYQAWIRFSNQSPSRGPDSERDIRGMAIKLMGVPGEKLLERQKNALTQDFILISTEAFVTRDVAQFDDLIKAMTGSLWAKICFFGVHWRVIRNLFRSMRKFANPLQIRYFSTTPYLFGATAAKYSAIPRIDRPDAVPANPASDYLRSAMVTQLGREEALFDFVVQLQTDAQAMPIEDPGRAWSEAASPWRKVATIRILRQEFDSDEQRAFGENLSFSPWHSLPAHRPLGGINRARRVVYDLISAFRHEYNHVPLQEPTGWEIGQPQVGSTEPSAIMRNAVMLGTKK